jgi:hypothetical protein
MSGKKSHVTPLKLRKQLLIAESELNRAQLSEEWQRMAHGVCDLGHRIKTIGAWASSAALLVAGVTALRRSPPVPETAKSSWFQKILSGARLASTVWFAFRARGEKADQAAFPARRWRRAAQALPVALPYAGPRHYGSGSIHPFASISEEKDFQRRLSLSTPQPGRSMYRLPRWPIANHHPLRRTPPRRRKRHPSRLR